MGTLLSAARLSLGVLCSAVLYWSTPGSAHANSEPSARSGDLVEVFDIAYTTPPGGDPASCFLDIYYRADGEPKRWMVFVHGGSWISGDKSNLRDTPMAEWFADRDYAVAALNFRLASTPQEPQTVTYADQSTDIAHALAWLRDNANEYEATDAPMLLTGFSSGAHLVALVGTDETYLSDAGIGFGALQAVVSLDVHAYDVPLALELMEGSEIENNIPLIEYLFGSTEAEQEVGSPTSYLFNNAIPPALIVSAEPSTVPGSRGSIASATGENYSNLLDQNGHESTWQHFDEETHNSLVSDFGSPGDGPAATVDAFLSGLSTAHVASATPSRPLLMASPNPFRETTILRFSGRVPTTSVHVRVYTATGREIRRLSGAERGVEGLAWDGRDREGREMPGGGYQIVLYGGDDRLSSTKVILQP